MSQVSRKKTRQLLFQKLFATSFGDYDDQTFQSSFFDGVFTFEVDEAYLSGMYDLVIEKEPYLIEVIRRFAPKFDPENMSLTYILPVFIGASEMLFYPEEIPAKVSINEAIELAKKYSDDSAKKIVNGVLNKLYENFETVKKDFETFETKE
ncbi:MAG: transcription antitermination protein NusB [Candidatus Peribacteria bacterium]|nr:MAG: transcription antitermination protein NusB [Candidatus Peribacteria bacterium]